MPYFRSEIEAMAGYVPGEQPQTTGYIKLNTNENPYPPSPAVAAALAAFDPATLRRYPDPLATAVRRRIAEIHSCTIDQVFAGNGSDEILALATRAFVEDDGSIGYFVPDARFDTYRREFGEKFEAIEIDPKDARPGGLKHPHSVLTINLAEDGPTKAAEARVLAFFQERTGAA